MANPNEKLAASLRELATLQAGGGTVFRSDRLSRVDRERLVANGFLGEACRGWLYLKAPGGRPGDSTPWYASIWEFCARYCDQRFGEDWHLSAHQSVLLHAENTTVPPQILVSSRDGANNRLALPFDTSVYDLKERTPTPGATSSSGADCGCCPSMLPSPRSRRPSTPAARSRRRPAARR